MWNNPKGRLRMGEVAEEISFLLSPPSKPFSGLQGPPDKSSAWIIGVPFDSTTSFKPGTRFAPQKIREVGWELESYNPSLGLDVEELPVADLGDTQLFVEYESLAFTLRRIARLSHVAGKTLFIVGGEHLITYPIVAEIKKLLKNLTLIVFDAHLDLRDEYPSGTRFSHATVMRRLAEEGVNIYYIGARAFSREEYEFLTSHPESLKIVSRDTLENIEGNLYISIDVDVIDPAYAPAVGNPEPLGITPSHLLSTLKELFSLERTKIVGLDIVEVNPLVDVNDVTSLLAAKILMESLFYNFSR